MVKMMVVMVVVIVCKSLKHQTTTIDEDNKYSRRGYIMLSRQPSLYGKNYCDELCQKKNEIKMQKLFPGQTRTHTHTGRKCAMVGGIGWLMVVSVGWLVLACALSSVKKMRDFLSIERI